MATDTVTISLTRDEAIILDDCLTRMFGDNDLHDWENVKFSFERECEQWPLFTVRDSLADQLNDDLTSQKYTEILDKARTSIAAQQWGDETD
jgi:hypothetical protein